MCSPMASARWRAWRTRSAYRWPTPVSISRSCAAPGWFRRDVRPPEEYARGHLPGAASLPLAELRRRLRDVPKDRDIVAYCRGPYCVYAHEAVRLLRSKGYAARRLEDGLPEWVAAGLPVE